MTKITDKSFVYTPSFDTDLKKKFRMIIERERKRASAQSRGSRVADTEDATVVPIATHALRTHTA